MNRELASYEAVTRDAPIAFSLFARSRGISRRRSHVSDACGRGEGQARRKRVGMTSTTGGGGRLAPGFAREAEHSRRVVALGQERPHARDRGRCGHSRRGAARWRRLAAGRWWRRRPSGDRACRVIRSALEGKERCLLCSSSMSPVGDGRQRRCRATAPVFHRGTTDACIPRICRRATRSSR